MYQCLAHRMFRVFIKYLVKEGSLRVRVSVLQDLLGYISESLMALNSTIIIWRFSFKYSKSWVSMWQTGHLKGICQAQSYDILLKRPTDSLFSWRFKISTKGISRGLRISCEYEGLGGYCRYGIQILLRSPAPIVMSRGTEWHWNSILQNLS